MKESVISCINKSIIKGFLSIRRKCSFTTILLETIYVADNN